MIKKYFKELAAYATLNNKPDFTERQKALRKELLEECDDESLCIDEAYRLVSKEVDDYFAEARRALIISTLCLSAFVIAIATIFIVTINLL